MLLSTHDHERNALNDLCVKPDWQILRARDEPHLDLLLLDCLHLCLETHLSQTHIYSRKALAVELKDVRNDRISRAHTSHIPNIQPTCQSLFRCLHPREGMLHLMKHEPGFLQKDLSRRRQRNGMVIALKEAHP